LLFTRLRRTRRCPLLPYTTLFRSSGVDGAAHDRRSEATALLIEPVDSGEVEARDQSGFGDVFLHTQGGEEGGDDTVGAVEAAPERLGVEVGTDEDVGGAGDELEAGEHVPDGVDADLEAVVGRPLPHPI